MLRLLIAVLIAGGVSGLAWIRASGQLHQADDIVGYPSYYDFNYAPMFLAHRLLTWVLPLGTALVYYALTRVGPLKVSRRPRPSSSKRRAEPVRADPQVSLADALLRSIAPAALIAIVLSSNAPGAAPALSGWALLVAAAYLFVVIVAEAAAAALTAGRVAVGLVSAVACAVVVPGALLFFSHTTQTIDVTGRTRTWPWLPWWVALGLALVLVAIVVSAHRQARFASAAGRWTASVVGGGALVFVLTTRLAPGVGKIQGFDDMHSVTGADLLSRGYFPWRDVLMLHGLFEDALRSNVGFALFGHSVWGANAANSMIWLPLLWVGYYLLTVWAAPRQWLLQVAVIAAVPWAAPVTPVSVRWVFLPYLLILFGWALRADRWWPTTILTLGTFVTAVIVPEESFLVVALAVTLIIFDLAGPDRARTWWRRLRRTRDFAVAGAAATLAWCLFLALHNSLRAWIAYYVYYGPGHSATGTTPLNLNDNGVWGPMFFASEVVTIVALAWVLVRFVQRREFTARYAVALVALLTTGLYAEKGIGLFDVGHIGQVLTVAICLWIVMVAIIADWISAPFAQARDRARRRGRRYVLAGAVHVSAAAVFIVTSLAVPALAGLPNDATLINAAPSHNRSTVYSQSGNPSRIGYTSVDGTDVTMVKDLSTLLARLTPPNATVYDFTNSPGYFTYLMQERLPTRFYTVGLALTAPSQRDLLAQLKASKPAAVVFDDVNYGLPAYGGPRNEVRHFLVAPYLLNGWTPVVDTYGFLIMIRNDLLSALPSLPSLSSPLVTKDLYFSSPACSWGQTPDFLKSTPVGAGPTLTVGPTRERRSVEATGWAFDSTQRRPVSAVLATVGRSVVAETTTGGARPDVAEAIPGRHADLSGFGISGLTSRNGPIRLYAELADGLAHPIGSAPADQPSTLKLPGGDTVGTSPVPTAGAFDTHSSARTRVASVELPAGVDLSKYGLATFSTASGALRTTSVRIFDRPSASPNFSHEISFEASRPTGSAVSIRVGACLQWHGYGGNKLYIEQDGGMPIASIRLSQVAP